MASRAEIDAEAKRPMAFFPHDANAHSDIKCRRLLRRGGAEAYGRWWLLCEQLAATNEHRLAIDTEEDAELIAEELQLDSADELMEFLAMLKRVGLVEMPGNGYVWSSRMMRNAEYFGEKRANGKRGGRPKKTTSEKGG